MGAAPTFSCSTGRCNRWIATCASTSATCSWTYSGESLVYGGPGGDRTLVLRFKRPLPPPGGHWPKVGPSGWTCTTDLPLIGRASWLLNDGRILVGRCGFDPLPIKGRVLQTRCRSHRLYLPVKLEPRGGIEPPSRPYQGRALAAVLAGRVGKFHPRPGVPDYPGWSGLEPYPPPVGAGDHGGAAGIRSPRLMGAVGLANRARRLSDCMLQRWRRAAGIEPLTLEGPPVFGTGAAAWLLRSPKLGGRAGIRIPNRCRFHPASNRSTPPGVLRRPWMVPEVGFEPTLPRF